MFLGLAVLIGTSCEDDDGCRMITRESFDSETGVACDSYTLECGGEVRERRTECVRPDGGLFEVSG